jgi:hypothetical protein
MTGVQTQPSPTVPAQAGPAYTRLEDVPGWLRYVDKMLFEWFLTRPGASGGDLLELGVFQGKTAIHIGRFRKPGETFTVVDLFDLARADKSIRPGARRAYADLTQATFERNYLSFHRELPTVVRGRTDVVSDHVAAGSCRFIHIDASHMYEHVRGDLLAARKLGGPDCVVVFDDYRTEHCPGTAAAVWEGVAADGLRPICVTGNKFYGTWGDARSIQDQLMAAIAERGDHYCDVQSVLGHRLIRVARLPHAPKLADGDSPERLLAEAREVLDTARRVLNKRPARSQHAPATWRQVRPGWRRTAAAVLPPVVADAVRTWRRGRRATGS